MEREKKKLGGERERKEESANQGSKLWQGKLVAN